MDQFEAARIKHLKNQERKTRVIPQGLAQVEPDAETTIPEVPKAKTDDGYIDVTVTLPSGSFSFRLVKKNILQNVPLARLNLPEIKKLIGDGLTPLMGRME